MKLTKAHNKHLWDFNPLNFSNGWKARSWDVQTLQQAWFLLVNQVSSARHPAESRRVAIAY